MLYGVISLPDNNFCMNVGRNHTSSGIYFQIKPTGVCQRCFCKKNVTDGRSNGVCGNYSSPEVPLTQILHKSLFGNTKVKKIINCKLTNVKLSSDKLNQLNCDEHVLICLNNCKSILLQLENELTG